MRFAMTGAAGFVAPRHMRAIKDTGNDLIAAFDPNDSVGVIDSYFPGADFFTEFERFDRHVEKVKRKSPVDYVSICSPNYLHDAHCRFAMRVGADAICEKPTVLNPWNIDALEQIEKETGKKVWNILQLRLHPSIIDLKNSLDPERIYDVDLTYLTSRGKWYFASWKGSQEKSGGVATNIGIHFFDMLSWVFGPLRESIVHIHRKDTASGLMCFKRARVRWFLSVDSKYLPKGTDVFRSISVDGSEIEFSNGFKDLHTESYKKIIVGHGFTLSDVRPSIEATYTIRNKQTIPLLGDYHPMCDK